MQLRDKRRSAVAATQIAGVGRIVKYVSDGIQVEAYIGFNTAHAGGNMRYPVYEYTVNGTTYRRAKTGVSYNSGHVAKMKDKPCKVLYNSADPGDSKAK